MTARPGVRDALAARWFTPEHGVELARAVAGDARQAVVMLLFDHEGLPVAVRSGGIGLPLTVAACRSLLGLFTSPEARGPTLVVSFDPAGDPATLAADWPAMVECMTAGGGRLVDWLLVTDGGVVSAQLTESGDRGQR